MMKLLCCASLLALLPCLALHAQFDSKTSMLTQSLGNKEIAYDNRAQLHFKPNGEATMIYSLEEGGFYLRHLDKNLQATKGQDLAFPDLQHYDMVVLDDNTFAVLAAGKANYTSAPSLIANYRNIAYLLKIDKTGKVLFKTQLMGHEGFKAGTFFLCSYSGGGELAYDGDKFSVFLETCGNFADNDTQEPDVHQTDYFMRVDKNGQVIKESLSPWQTSHSSLIQMALGKDKTAFTLSIGDAYPFGLNFCAYQNNKQTAKELLYPEQDKLPSEDMYSLAESSTDAGQIGSLQTDGDNLLTVMATIAPEKMPIKQQPKDLLLLKWSASGEILSKKWLTKTANIDEAMPYLMPYNNGWLLIYHQTTEEYQIDGKAILVLLDKEGNMQGIPYASDLNIDWHSQFFTYPNGDVGWLRTAPYASEVEVYRIAR